jgi:type 1 glutamine amidotransferase
MSLKCLPAVLATVALIATAPYAVGQSAPTAEKYSPTAPANCCTYSAPRAPGQNANGMHVYLFGGLKSHRPGEHDYPQWLADWSKLLTAHGAVVDGAFHAPSGEDLAHTDVLMIYKGDSGFMTPAEHATIAAFVKRGGGIVSLHDALCGPDPADFAALVGAGKRHGEVNFTLGAPIAYKIVDAASPIMKGVEDGLVIYDEAFYKMTWAKNPEIHALATAVIPDTPSAVKGGGVNQTVPQIWTYEHTVPGGQPARAFVWMQGHTYANYSNPQIENMLLRGIAWAGKQPVDSLVDYKAPPLPAGPRPEQ